VPSKFYGIAAAGRPLIAVGALDGEIARLISCSRCGASVGSGDSAEFARIVLELAQDPAVGGRMGARARALIDQRFARRRAFAGWADLLDRFSASDARV
jgi:colanic acid biosynthesis glycosyl transferase WcaI